MTGALTFMVGPEANQGFYNGGCDPGIVEADVNCDIK